jgi:DNA-binding NarL/FixJ family response regulator
MDQCCDVQVLVVEDYALIAMYVEDLLDEAGYTNVCTMSSCEAALGWLQRHTPQFAIIEMQMEGGNCEAVACLLEQRSIPYVVHTSAIASDPDGILQRHPDCFCLSKPCDPEQFLCAIKAMPVSRLIS